MSDVLREAERLCPIGSRKIGTALHVSLMSGPLRNRYAREAVRLLADLDEIFGRSTIAETLPDAIVLWLVAIALARERGESIGSIAKMIDDRRLEIMDFRPVHERQSVA